MPDGEPLQALVLMAVVVFAAYVLLFCPRPRPRPPAER